MALVDESDVRELEELQRSPEWAIAAMLENLTSSYQVNLDNYHELMEVAGPIDDPDVLLRMWSVDNRAGLEKVIAEVERRLVNFLASSMSLVAHTREHVKDLYGQSEFKKEYEREVAHRLSTNPVRCFVQDLRNYSLHFKIPFAGASLEIRKGQAPQNSFRLSTGPLKKWDRWTSHSRSYIEAAGEYIDIGQLAKDYMKLIQEFYLWFRGREAEIHGESLSLLEQRKARLRAKFKWPEEQNV